MVGRLRAGRVRRLATLAIVSGWAAVVVTAPGEAASDLAPRRVDLSAPAQATGVVPDLGALGWDAVLDEGFSGTGLDESLWDIRTGPGTSGPGLTTRDAVSVADGELKISTYTDDGGEDYTGEVALGAMGADLGFFGAYGYLEARIRLQNRGGTRSAFWTLSPTWHKSPFGDPAAAGPEFDIMEVFADDPERVNVGKHWDGFDEDHKQDTWKRTNPTSVPIQGNYHVYSLLWTPDGYRAYIDGHEVYRSTDAITYSPAYVILSQHQSDGQWTGRPSGGYGALGAAENAVMTVDYVRLWQRPISEIPDQTVPANSPVAIPFSVQDHFASSTSRAEPGSVRVAASVVSGSSVVPAGNVVVTGDGPADPDGLFANQGFEEGAACPTSWTCTGAATSWTTRAHTGARALRLTEAGGRATQLVTGLRPDTTYVVGGWYNLDLGYTDTDGNGRVTWNGDADGDGRADGDEIEPLTEADGTDPDPEVDDGAAVVDWGIQDVDTARAGDQDVTARLSRNAAKDAESRWWAVADDEWRQDNLVFTTGPSTTQVTLFVDNQRFAGAGDRNDSDLSFDDVWVQPLVPAHRTLSVRPLADVTGSATIRLTATDAAGQTMGTEDVTLTFTKGSSFTNGGFEASPAGAGWNLTDVEPGQGADVVVDDPFRLDRVLELGRDAVGVAGQRVTNLRPNTSYTLEVTARGDVDFRFVGLTGTDPCATPGTCKVDTPDWSTVPVTFTTDATGTGMIQLVDWNPGDGVSLVREVELTTTHAAAPVPPAVSPALASIGEQRIVSSAPHVLLFSESDVQITDVTASNLAVLPRPNIGFLPTGSPGMVILTPVTDRTGAARVRVDYTVPDGSDPGPERDPRTHEIPVVVSDNHLADPGFERDTSGWMDATVVTTGQRSGTGALAVNGPTPASQFVTWLPYNTGFVVGGHGRAGARLTVRRDGVDVGTLEWTGATWSEAELTFTMPPCSNCMPNGQSGLDDPISSPTPSEIQLVVQDMNPTDGAAAYVDDLYLVHAPAASSIADLSLHLGQTQHDSNTQTTVWVGRVPANARWDPTVVALSSSDPTVLPVPNLRVAPADQSHPNQWHISAVAAGVTGRSVVTLTLTDPSTGNQTQRSFLVTVNAGTSFNDGDFTRELDGWIDHRPAVTEPDQFSGWGRIEMKAATSPTPTPSNWDWVARLHSGLVGNQVTGLTPSTDHRLRFVARGDGATVQVRDTANVFEDPAAHTLTYGGVPAVVTIDSSGGWTTYDVTFTTRPSGPGSTSVWIQILDAAESSPGAGRCATTVDGESCYDDVGLFRLSDVG